MQSTKKNIRVAVVSAGLLLISIWLRLQGLERFLTPDEKLWSSRVAQFLAAISNHDWAATSITGHPGVTTMWAGSLGALARWQALPAEPSSFADYVTSLAAGPLRPDLFVWLRAPVAIICALGMVASYLLVYRVVGERLALASAILLAFDPFLLSHGRVLQMDALLSTFLTLGWLCVLVATRTHRRSYLACSGVAFALAILTKSPALVAGPIVAVWLAFSRWRGRRPGSAWVGSLALDFVAVGLPAVLVAFALWPALWVAPLETADRVWKLMTAYGGLGHELGNFWLGRPVSDPGLPFYAVVLLFRTTAVTLIGLLLALVAAARRSIREGERQLVAGAVLFVVWFGAILSFGDKKFDRYLLPIFPCLDILAAWGWVALARWCSERWGERFGRSSPARKTLMAPMAFGLLAVAQAAAPLANLPSFLTAYNPLVGGIRAASRMILVGWGEGLAEAAVYVSGQPDAAGSRVATWYGQNVFGVFFEGRSYDLYYDLQTAEELYSADIDYVVPYINQVQRGLLLLDVQAKLENPLFSYSVDGVPIAQVFRWPKPYRHTCDMAIGDDLRLLGWEAEAAGVGSHDIALGLAWDAAPLADLSTARQVTGWIKDAAGDVWATCMGEVSGGTAPVPGWLDTMVVEQECRLSVPSGLIPGAYRLEVAPLGGSGILLGETQIAATLLAAESASITGVTQPEQQVLFGDAVRLEGSSLMMVGEATTLDLAWGVVSDPPAGMQLFVHVVDESGETVAQADVPWGRLLLPNGEPDAWSPSSGQLVRQRVHLRIPQPIAAGGYQVYVGLYNPGDGTRMAATADGLRLEDKRFLLTTLSGAGS